MTGRTAGIALAACALLLGGCSKSGDEVNRGAGAKAGDDVKPAAATAENDVTPYPLDICVVSGKKLGSMGEAYVIGYQGREIKFCCDGCEEDFRAEPAKFLAKIDDAAN